MSGASPGSMGATLFLFVAGAAIAVIGSMCGVGGGIFAVPVLHYLFGLELRKAIATSLCLVLATSAAATLGEAMHPRGELFPLLIVVLTAGALLGAQIGFRLSTRLPVRAIKALFCVLLLFTGVRLIASLSGGEVALPAAATGFAAGTGGLLLTLAVGTLGGLVAPLLGIGGGLIVVPALLFFMPEVGYLGARAASLAMAMVTSAHSVWLYSAERSIDRARALPFATGAILGGVVGVWLVHKSSGTIVGATLLGATLLVAGVRFAFDVLPFRR